MENEIPNNTFDWNNFGNNRKGSNNMKTGKAISIKHFIYIGFAKNILFNRNTGFFY